MIVHEKVGSPSVLNVFVDATCDSHGHNSIIPGGDEHESETQAHSQKRQSPGGKKNKRKKVVQETDLEQQRSPITSSRCDPAGVWKEQPEV